MEDNVNLYQRALYAFVPECKEELIKLEKTYRQTNRTFAQILAYSAQDTGMKTRGGRDIKYSYIPWHNAFMSSTDNKNGNYLTELCSQTGAMAFGIFNYAKNNDDYIIALNKDVYDNVPYPIYMLTLAHEFGHAIADHAFTQNRDRDERSTDRELEADSNGFELLTNYFKEDKNIFKPDMISHESWNFKHYMACPVMAYGPKGLDIIQKEYNKKNRFEMYKEITNYILKMDTNENEYEESLRSQNYLNWLKKSA